MYNSFVHISFFSVGDIVGFAPQNFGRSRFVRSDDFCYILYHKGLVGTHCSVHHVGDQLHISSTLLGRRYFLDHSLVGSNDSSGHCRLVRVHRYLGPGYC